MRCFLAIDLPDGLRDKLSTLQKELKGLDMNLVDKEGFHFTLKFLGEIDEDAVNKVIEKMNTIKQHPFDVDLTGIGFFPSKDAIRVVWVGSKSEELVNLHVLVNDLLADMFPKEKSVPHMTLARVRSLRFKNEIQSFGKVRENERFGSFTVNKIKLKRSVLRRSGPVYNDIKSWNL